MIYIGCYYGKYKPFEEQTGYTHGEKTSDSIETVVKNVLNAGLNIQILQSSKTNDLTVWIDSGRFHQR